MNTRNPRQKNIVNPINLDSILEQLSAAIEGNFSWVEKCYGEAKLSRDSGGLTYPRVYANSREYDMTLQNDNLKSSIFFYKLNQTLNPETNFYQCRMAIIANLHMERIYQSNEIETVEFLQNDIIQLLKAFPKTDTDAPFQIINNDPKEVYKEFSRKVVQTFPYSCFRIEFSLSFLDTTLSCDSFFFDKELVFPVLRPSSVDNVIVKEAGETIGAYRVVKLIDDKAYIVDGNNVNNYNLAVGVTMGAVLIGENVSIKTYGELQVAQSIINNAAYYPNNVGVLVNTLPSSLVGEIARGIDSNKIFINPFLNIELL